MKFSTAAVALLAIAVLAFAGIVIAWLGLDQQMAAGLAAGLIAGVGLTLLGGRGLGRALRHERKNALIVQLYGGFFLRMVLLVVGFGVLYVTGAANPVGFAVAFLVGAVLALFHQVIVYTNSRPAAAGGA
jgi:hypothetical protein